MTRTPQKKLKTTSYHVAWICPVSNIELLPALLMLDEEHERPDINDNPDEILYHYGSAAGHNVVLATCRQGMTGNVNASSISGPLFRTFPNIRMTLLVGIGGGVPQPESFSEPLNDLRLGDVVIGWPTSASGMGAVIYYDSGRSRVGGFEITGTMDKPHKVILNGLTELGLRNERGRTTFHKHMAKLQRDRRNGKRYMHPGLEHDKLYKAAYRHSGDYGSDCAECDNSELVKRTQRDDKDLFIYHQGHIATGNSVVMDGEKRDSISTECGGVLCIEMEAAGIEVHGRVLVIRGISDYADSHKSDLWREYAAAKAVACARELLGIIPATQVKEEMSSGRRSVINRIVKTITPNVAAEEQQRFVLTGMGGQGKSEICLHVANKIRDRFWAIFWIDVGKRGTAEENFSKVGEMLECERSVEAVRKVLSNLPPTKPWLLILDNADDLRGNYYQYIPSGNRGAILMTSRSSHWKHLATAGGHEELQNLEEADSIELLHKVTQFSSTSKSTCDDALTLVKHLGYHALAITQAGACISNSRCSIPQYLNSLKSNRDDILRISSLIPMESRYKTVFATIEASMAFLKIPEAETAHEKRTCNDALQLLQVLSTFNHTSVRLELLVDAWKGARAALKRPTGRRSRLSELTAWHVAQVPAIIRTSKDSDDVKQRITEAVSRLESLALVRTGRDAPAWKFVSMHPLIHRWAGERHDQLEKKRISRMTECIIALSTYAGVGCRPYHHQLWRPYHHQLMTHLELLIESDESLVDDAAQSNRVLQICVQVAWAYRWMGLYRKMYEFTSRIFQRLGLHYQKPTYKHRELYRVFAVAVDGERSHPAEALRAFEAIQRLDNKTRGKSDKERLDNLADLGNAYRHNSQEACAIELLTEVVEGRKKLGEGHNDLIQAHHDLAMAFMANGKIKKAIALLGTAVSTNETLLAADHLGLLSLQQALAVAYLKNGEISNATCRLSKLALIEADNLSERHPRTADTYNWLAKAYEKGGRLSEAIEVYGKVVNIRKRFLRKEHPNLLAVQHELASAYLDANRAQKAIDILERVVSIEKSTLDKTDLSRLKSQQKLAQAYLKIGNGGVSKAIDILEQVVNIKKSILEEYHPSVLAAEHWLLEAYLKSGRVLEAAEMVGCGGGDNFYTEGH